MVKIRHKKAQSIDYKLCADVAPQYFQMDDEDLAQLLHSKNQGVFQIAEGFEQTEEGCPVDIIHINW